MTAAPFTVLGLQDAAGAMPQSRLDKERLLRAAVNHFDDVWRFLRSLGVPRDSLDDATQEVFLRAARKFSTVSPGAEKGYLFATSVHVAQELRRKFAREELAEDPEDGSLELPSFETPEDSLAQKEQRHLLLGLLDGLPDGMRSVFVLYEIEGQSLSEISALLGVPMKTVASRLGRARSRFEVRLQRLKSRLRGES
jgi:RNA polymerase sigma-70 factor, ECF subfamily